MKNLDFSVIAEKSIPLPEPEQKQKKIWTKGPSARLQTMKVGNAIDIPFTEDKRNSVKTSVKTAAKRINIEIECRFVKEKIGEGEAATETEFLRVWRKK